MKETVRYSEAFKLHLVHELEAGRFRSAFEAGRAYGVKGRATVSRWLRLYGKNHLLGKVVRVMKANEQTETQALRKRVKDLEKALANAHMDAALGEAYLSIACERAGITDIEEFKKKNAVNL